MNWVTRSEGALATISARRRGGLLRPLCGRRRQRRAGVRGVWVWKSSPRAGDRGERRYAVTCESGISAEGGACLSTFAPLAVLEAKFSTYDVQFCTDKSAMIQHTANQSGRFLISFVAPTRRGRARRESIRGSSPSVPPRHELERSESMSARKMTASPAKSASSTSREPSVPETAQAVLAELFWLLEEYGPLWYTEDHHRRATRALAEMRRRRGFSVIEGRTSEKRVN